MRTGLETCFDLRVAQTAGTESWRGTVADESSRGEMGRDGQPSASLKYLEAHMGFYSATGGLDRLSY